MRAPAAAAAKAVRPPSAGHDTSASSFSQLRPATDKAVRIVGWLSVPLWLVRMTRGVTIRDGAHAAAHRLQALTVAPPFALLVGSARCFSERPGSRITAWNARPNLPGVRRPPRLLPRMLFGVRTTRHGRHGGRP